jgi:LmbE family N-acetylglucosaminyl deacetylase
MLNYQALQALATLGIAVLPSTSAAQRAQAPGEALRIIAFGAHPDDCELDAGGVAAMGGAGHKFKCVSVTNGDIGHATIAGGPLALRRRAEALAAATILGIETEVLDNHDGELMVTLENRRRIAGLIREWQADVVISHRPNDYHPDHRYTGVLVMDAAYMVQVSSLAPRSRRSQQRSSSSRTASRSRTHLSGDIVVGIDARD